MRVLVTRPIEASHLLAGKIQDLGIDVDIAPMLAINLKAEAIQLDSASALVYTSRNAVNAFIESGQKFEGTIFAVGEATADALRAAGCKNTIAAEGNVKSLVACIKSHANLVEGSILHLSGENTRGNLVGELERAGLSASRQVVYTASPCTGFEPRIQEKIKRRNYNAILFFSPRSARTFVSLLMKNDMSSHVGACSAIVMSKEVAREARAVTWQQILVTSAASEKAMIDCLQPPGEQGQPKGK